MVKLVEKLKRIFSGRSEDSAPVQDSKLEEEVKLYSIQDLPSESPGHLYVPNEERKQSFMDNVKGYWDALKPRKAFDYVAIAATPIPGVGTVANMYRLWKLPPEYHSKLNSLLSSATTIAEKEPRAALALGITYAISQAIYGLKTKSGKHVLSGLQGIISNTSKDKISKLGPADRLRANKINQQARSLTEVIGRYKSSPGINN